MNYKAEVIADASGKWVSNELVFATEEEAKQYLDNLASRWTAVRQTRVVESSDKVNATWWDGKLQHLDGGIR